MPNIPPAKERSEGWYHEEHYPGLVRMSWALGPFHLTRERRFEDSKNTKLKASGVIVSAQTGTHRAGLKWESDVAS